LPPVGPSQVLPAPEGDGQPEENAPARSHNIVMAALKTASFTPQRSAVASQRVCKKNRAKRAEEVSEASSEGGSEVSGPSEDDEAAALEQRMKLEPVVTWRSMRREMPGMVAESGLHHMRLGMAGHGAAFVAMGPCAAYLAASHTDVEKVFFSTLQEQCDGAPGSTLTLLGLQRPALLWLGVVGIWVCASITMCIIFFQLEIRCAPRALGIGALAAYATGVLSSHTSAVFNSGEAPNLVPYFAGFMVLLGTIFTALNRYPLVGEPRTLPWWRLGCTTAGTIVTCALPVVIVQLLAALALSDVRAVAAAGICASKMAQMGFTHIFAEDASVPLEVAVICDFYAGAGPQLFVRAFVAAKGSSEDTAQAAFIMLLAEVAGAVVYAAKIRRTVVQSAEQANRLREEYVPVISQARKTELEEGVTKILGGRDRRLSVCMASMETDAVAEAACLSAAPLVLILGYSMALTNTSRNLDTMTLGERAAAIAPAWGVALAVELLSDFLVGCIHGAGTGGFVSMQFSGRSKLRLLAACACALAAVVQYTYAAGAGCDVCRELVRETCPMPRAAPP